MSALACDRCDRSLLANEDVRYEVEVTVKAAYESMWFLEGLRPPTATPARLRRRFSPDGGRSSSVRASPGRMELNLDRIRETDYTDELARLVQRIEGKTAEELEAEVYKRFHFDLCLRCQREYVRDPLPRRAPDA